MIYGPLWFKNAIVKVDPKDGKDTVVASGFQTPAAANFGPDGNLYAIDTKTGEVKRIDMKSKAVTLVATLAPALDNLAFGPNGLMYVSNMADATIYEVNPADGAVRTVVKGPLATPTDLALTDGPEGERLHVADIFAYRVINTADGAITDPLRMYRDETENQLGIGAGKSKVLITSWSTGVVQVVDRATGAAVMHHGLAAPMDAIELADGRLLALEAATGTISVLAAPDAKPEPLVTGLAMPVSMVETPDGKLYITETGGALAQVDLATKQITRIAEDLSGPEGIDVGADGRIYLAEAGAGRVIAIDPKDNARTVLAEGLKFGLPAVEGTLPAFAVTGVAVSKKDGAVYVSSDLTNAIYKLTPPSK
jgi:streptogramin lyase